MPVTTETKPLILRSQRLGDFALPAAGGTDVINVDTAKNVHGVYLYLTASGTAATEAEMKSDIGQIVVTVGGSEILNLTATEVLDLYGFFNDRNGAYTFTGQLPLIFTPAMLPLTEQTARYALGMLNDQDPTKRNTFSIRVTMLSPGGGLTVDNCEVHLVTDDFAPSTIGYHTRWITHTRTFGSAAKETVDNLPKERNNMAALGYHIHHTSGTLTRVNLKVSDYDRFSDSPMQILRIMADQAGRTPVAAYEHLGFDFANSPRGFLELSQAYSQYLDLTWSVKPDTYYILGHYLYKGL